MEGLSGTKFNDVLTGTNELAADRLPTRSRAAPKATRAARSTPKASR